LGILKAGAAYVPIDPNLPKERQQFIIEETNLKTLIIHSEMLFEVVELDVSVLAIDLQLQEMLQAKVEAPEVLIDPQQLAYLIYTSGSTGRPKGVMIEHRAIANTIVHQIADFDLDAADRCLQFASLSFDASVWEIFLALCSGAQLCIVDEVVRGTPQLFEQYLNKHNISFATLPPPFLNELAIDQLHSLRTLVTAGEAAHLESALAFSQMGTYYNAYGPTESSVCASKFAVQANFDYSSGKVPIGFPNTNTQLYIVDEQGQLLPPGFTGELCIAGRGLARGYFKRPDLTEAKFIANPFVDNPRAKMYKTGDLARWTSEGAIEFWGRKDDQIKLRGYRIELGEIEKALLNHHFIENAVVLLYKGESNVLELTAYLVLTESYSTQQLKEDLSAQLPSYMIPTHWVVAERLPRNNAGKIDKNALRRLPIQTQKATAYSAPTTSTEQQLVELWKELLDLEKIGIKDSFFDVGGHSLLAMRLISAIRKNFQVQLNVIDIFNHPDIASLGALLDQQQQTDLVPLAKLTRPERIPLSFAQERMWFIDQLQGSVQYHQPYVLRLSNRLNWQVLSESLRALVQRHEVLRSVIRSEEGTTYQLPLAAENWQLQSTAQEEVAMIPDLDHYIKNLIDQPFDLSQDYTLRAHLIEKTVEEHLLVLVFHHIASDAWSQALLVKDFIAIYAAQQKGKTAQLPQLTWQYADYAVWQNTHLIPTVLSEQLDWWENQLKDTPRLELPTDFPRPAQMTNRGHGIGFWLEQKTSDELNQLAKDNGASLFMTLLTAFNVLLYQYTGQKDICIGTPIANRSQSEWEPIAGLFINTLTLRNRWSGQPTFVELLAQVKQANLAAQAHQAVPFEQVIQRLKGDSRGQRNPLFQVVFGLINTPEIPELSMGDLQIVQESVPHTTAIFDLNVAVTAFPTGL
ncbi:MAG: amino acid adenylation domain-containing protein, partial [Bacteroidota bacterium]